LPLVCFASFFNQIWVSKRLRWRSSGQELSVQEYLQNSFYYSSEYEASGIDVIDMTPEEITWAFQEFWQRCAGTWQAEHEDELKQAQFWDACMAWPEYSTYHGWRHPAAKAGAAWLRSVPIR